MRYGHRDVIQVNQADLKKDRHRQVLARSGNPDLAADVKAHAAARELLEGVMGSARNRSLVRVRLLNHSLSLGCNDGCLDHLAERRVKWPPEVCGGSRHPSTRKRAFYLTFLFA
jgi:hypothetical protein